MNDSVFITDLAVEAVIGVYSWERAIDQRLLISAEILCDIRQAGQTDDVSHAINYKSVCDDITKICQQTKAKLLERLGEIICQHILTAYPCQSVTLTIAKPNAIKQASAVGIKLVRTKADLGV
jgi:dihydroneopterin aldolase